MGAIFGPSVKTGVQNPGDGKTTYFDSPAQAGAALAREARASVEPSTSVVDGTLSAPSPDVVDVSQQDPGNIIGPRRGDVVNVIPGTPQPDTTTVSMAAPQPVQPTFAPKVSFADAYSAHPELLTKGGSLRALLADALTGGAAGAAASAEGNPHIGYAGLGAAAGAGFQAPLALKGSLRSQQMAQRAAEQEMALRQAQTELDMARANRATVYHNPDGSLWTVDPNGQPVLHPGQQRPDAGDQVTATVQAKLQQAEAAGLNREQTLTYVYGVRPEKGPATVFGAYLDAAGGDPQAALAAYNRDNAARDAYKAKLRLKGTTASKTLDGMTTAQARTLRNDSEWSSLSAQSKGLSKQLIALDPADPKYNQVHQQLATVNAAMETRKQAVLSPNSGGGQSNPLTVAEASSYLTKAGWDGKTTPSEDLKTKARALAKADGRDYASPATRVGGQ